MRNGICSLWPRHLQLTSLINQCSGYLQFLTQPSHQVPICNNTSPRDPIVIGPHPIEVGVSSAQLTNPPLFFNFLELPLMPSLSSVPPRHHYRDGVSLAPPHAQPCQAQTPSSLPTQRLSTVLFQSKPNFSRHSSCFSAASQSLCRSSF